MIAFITFLRITHITTAVLWFAFGLGQPGDIKRSLAAGAAHVPPMIQRIEGQTRRILIAGVVTLASGFGLIVARGGFKGLPVRYHVGLALAIAIFVVGGAVVRPAWLGVKAAALKGDFDSARAGAKRMAAGSGVIQLLWTIIIVLMVHPFEF